MQQSLYAKLGIVPFQHLPLLTNGQKQTIASYFFPYNPFLQDEKAHFIHLTDGDVLNVIENRPSVTAKSGRIILLVHGLTGSHRSKYLIRMSKAFLKQGYLTLRLNLRGCGLGQGLAKNLYHSGRSEDTRAVLNWIVQMYPNRPVTIIGFSLGGNIVLKMAGEDGKDSPPNLDSVMAISPPLDLYRSVKLLTHKTNQILNDHFVKALQRDAKIRHQLFKEMPLPAFTKNMNVYDFDNTYTAPLSGFKDAKDYYQQSSSFQYLHRITLPTFMLYSLDDPVISRHDFFNIPPKENFDVLITKKGGHVAWLGYTQHFGRFRWMDNTLVKWVNWFDTQNNTT